MTSTSPHNQTSSERPSQAGIIQSHNTAPTITLASANSDIAKAFASGKKVTQKVAVEHLKSANQHIAETTKHLTPLSVAKPATKPTIDHIKSGLQALQKQLKVESPHGAHDLGDQQIQTAQLFAEYPSQFDTAARAAIKQQLKPADLQAAANIQTTIFDGQSEFPIADQETLSQLLVLIPDTFNTPAITVAPTKTTPPAPDPNASASSLEPESISLDINDYKGTNWTPEQLQKIAANLPAYLKAQAEFDVPWEFMAELHDREHALTVSNPSNGQGVYQFYAEAGQYPAGPISEEEFTRQTLLAAKRIQQDYAQRGMKDVVLSAEHIDAQKVMETFGLYNGLPKLYKRQAVEAGYSADQAFMGSPYVVNLLSDAQNSQKNPNWQQYLGDGKNVGPANQQPGAWLGFKDLVEIAGDSNKLVDQIGDPAPAPAPTEQAPSAPVAEIPAAPEGTTDLGIHTGYHATTPHGNSFESDQIRLVAVPGFKSPTSSESQPGDPLYIDGADGNIIVNAKIAANVLAMYQAAQADGIDLSVASSFRSMQHQQQLFAANPNRAEVAFPGRSNHQDGLAFDLNLGNGLRLHALDYATADGNAPTITNPRIAPTSAVWVWMMTNGHKFGLRQYFNEPWHWELDPNAEISASPSVSDNSSSQQQSQDN